MATIIRLAVVIFTIVLITNCKKEGIYEKLLNEQIQTVISVDGSKQTEEQKKETYSSILNKLQPLLDSHSYTDPLDLTKKEEIQYKASLLAASIAIRMNEPAKSLGYYIGAFIIHPDRAMQDLTGFSKQGADLSIFKIIYIPEYQIKDSAIQEGSLKTKAIVNKALPSYLLMVLAGDILQKTKKKGAAFQQMEIEIEMAGEVKDPAAGNEHVKVTWNEKEDHIHIKIPPGWNS